MDAERQQAEVLRQYSEHVNPYLARLMSFAGFSVETRSEGCYIWDIEGRKYLDCLGGFGVYSVGHRHPRVIEAVKRQLDIMPMSGKAMFNPTMALLAERLAELAPDPLQYVFFSNSGTEAVEAALKFAKAATGRTKVVSTVGGFHGKTIGSLSVTGRDMIRTPFEPLLPGPEFVDYGDSEALTHGVDELTAAVIVETLQGEGGIRVPPADFLPAVRQACSKVGALLIVDEVQTGLGRTGRMFGCEGSGVRPDIMTLAKGLGGGVMPIGATLGSAEIWERVFSQNPLMHTSTFGGNPLACAAALAALDVIQDEGLVERSRTVGAIMKAALGEAAKRAPDLVAEVRGEGLMLGVEFTQDDVAELAIAQMVKRGLIAAYTLNNKRVIRFEPPLIITEQEARWAAQVFGEALAETSELLVALA